MKLLDLVGVVDTHCHLNDKQFEADLPDIIARAKNSGIDAIIDVAVDLGSAERAAINAKLYEGFVYPTIGIHPQNFVPGDEAHLPTNDENFIADSVGQMRNKIAERQFAAIGECGLDYYWLARSQLPTAAIEQSYKLQQIAFAEQIKLALECDLPMTIHARESVDACLNTLEEIGAGKSQGVMHCFTGDLAQAERAKQLGMYIGVGAIATYTSGKAILRIIYESLIDVDNAVDKLCAGVVAGDLPLSDFINVARKAKIVFETDAPYLPPKDRRGQRHEPAFLPAVIRDICAGLIS